MGALRWISLLWMAACVPAQVEESCLGDDDCDEGLFCRPNGGCQNLAPLPGRLMLHPARPVTTDRVQCRVTSDPIDPDGDPIFTSMEWSLDGAPIPLGLTGEGLPADLAQVGQTISCAMTASDGRLASPKVRATATVDSDVCRFELQVSVGAEVFDWSLPIIDQNFIEMEELVPYFRNTSPNEFTPGTRVDNLAFWGGGTDTATVHDDFSDESLWSWSSGSLGCSSSGIIDGQAHLSSDWNYFQRRGAGLRFGKVLGVALDAQFAPGVRTLTLGLETGTTAERCSGCSAACPAGRVVVGAEFSSEGRLRPVGEWLAAASDGDSRHRQLSPPGAITHRIGLRARVRGPCSR